MPSTSQQWWEARELIPFLQRVFAHRVRTGDALGREWDRAWYRVVQSARHHVRKADGQDYTSTPFRIVERLYQGLIDPYGSNDPILARMSIESCAIVFIQHAKTHGTYPLHSRQSAWPPPGFAFNIKREEAIERQSRQQWDSVDPIER